MRKYIKKYFIAGLLVVVPLYISLYVVYLLVNAMDSIFYILPESIRPNNYMPFHIPGLGIVVTITGIFIVGVVVTNFLGRKLVELGEAILARIPFMRTIYNVTKQFMTTFFSKDSHGFNRVVLLEYPRKGMYSIGFVTSKTRGEIQERTDKRTVNVFIPTTPNPTSGFYFAVPEEDIIPLDMTVEDAFKVIMSGGMVTPEKGKNTDNSI